MEQRHEHDPTESATPAQRSLKRGMVVVLAVLVVLVLVFPTGLANWFDDTCIGNWFCDGASEVLWRVEDFWRSIGVAGARDGLGDWLREVLNIPDR